ncbi:MAG TPA: 3-dehydroquinate synthase [Pyrinomonadaceae bacterium]|jgi:3-dehydroquinate synthase|nr:3-dehydroquinate synthase [Pyrinomonadaceae bacterium]
MAFGGQVRRVRVCLKGGGGYPIDVGPGTLSSLGAVARLQLAAEARRVALVSNPCVFDLYGARAVASLRGAGFKVSRWLMGDGERFKNLRTAERCLRFLSESGLERTDAVAALGGGVVGDLAGFAAALYLRGVAFMQVPTTLLAQIDSSVGGKTGVNTRAGKNLFGAFHQPRAVVVDTKTLRTLPARELTAGWCEAIKQGAVGDRTLFERTLKFLEGELRRTVAGRCGAGRNASRVEAQGEARGEGRGGVVDEGRDEELAELIAAQCAFKAKIVAGDEREDISRADARSRRVLNFGHTVGHALETLTNYRRFRHGEAVGHGMIAAAEISKRLGLLDDSELESLRGAVRAAGQLPAASDLDAGAIARALRADKKAVGGSVRWVLLERIGLARIVDGREVSPRVIGESIRAALGTR